MFFNKEDGLIVPSKKQNNTNNKTMEIKSLNGYGAIRQKMDEGNALTVKSPVEQPTKLKTKLFIGL